MTRPRFWSRWTPLLATGGLLLLVAVPMLILASLPGAGAASMVGTDLRSRPAPDFRLVDQFGQTVSLSGLRGKVVVATFLYTNCPDICPLVTGKFGAVRDQLGGRSDQVAFVAITVDPERDTVARMRQYLEMQGLADKIIFLTGERAILEVTWDVYHIAVSRPPSGSGAADDDAYEVMHTSALYVIDKQGRERRLMREDFAPADMLRNLEVLLRE